MDEIELVLIKLVGLLKEPQSKITLTSQELAEKLGVSQQTASRYLIKLENREFINRTTKGRKQELQLTEKGINILDSFSNTLARFFHKKHKPIIKGSVVSGLREGAYYIKQYELKILQVLGFRPYLGTLNIRVDGSKPDLNVYSSNRVDGFSHGGRQFGALDLVPAELDIKGNKMECFVALPERTHHKRDIEVISQFNLRSRYNIKDGDKAILTIK